MHRTLQVLDIVYIIAEHMDRKSLLTMSHVSRLFWLPCMNSLWSDVGSLTPLLRLLPSHLKHNNPDGVEEFLHSWPMPKKSDWIRYNIYAPLVRELSIEVSDYSFNHEAVTEETFQNLVLYHSSRPRFPKLQYLTLELNKDSLLQSGLSLLSSSILALELSVEEKVGQLALSSFLQLLPESTPVLTSLEVKGRSLCTRGMYAPLGTVISSLEHLSDFTLWFASDMMINGEGDNDFDVYESPSLNHAPPTARNLETLELCGPPQFFQDILRHMALPKLEVLKLSVHRTDLSNTMRGLMHALVSSVLSLQTLEMHVYSMSEGLRDSSLRDCGLLLHMQGLVNATVTGVTNNYQDADYRHFCQSWQSWRA